MRAYHSLVAHVSGFAAVACLGMAAATLSPWLAGCAVLLALQAAARATFAASLG